jgi:putative transposase
LTGLEVRFGASTIERWYYAARGATDPMAMLRNQIRSDIGSFPSVATEAAEALDFSMQGSA